MQGGSAIAVTLLLLAVPPAASLGQVPGAPQLPAAPVPQLPPAPVPQLPPAPAPVPSLPPAPRVPAPSVPALPAPSLPAVPAPSLPEVRAPSVTAPRVPSPRLPAAAPGAPSSGQPGTTSGPAGAPGSGSTGTPAAAPSPTSAGAGPSGSSSRRSARAAARLRRGGGVLGTSFATRRGLVSTLRGCVDSLPPRHDRLLTLRYGVGPAKPRPAREVAAALDLPAGGYGVVQRRALRGLVRAARGSGCEGGASAPLASEGHATGAAIASVAGAYAAAARESERGKLAVLGEQSSSRQEPGGERRSGLGTPLALDADAPGSSSLATLLLVLALGLLCAVAARPLLAALRRVRDHPSDAR